MMELIKISKIKPNPNNPRLVKDDKFAKLVKSLQEFPDMAKVRPIVCNKDMIVLGGNMRLKAMKEAGWKDVPVQVVDWDEEQQRQFIIKDNIGYGEWDWENLAINWDNEKLEEWGLEVPKWAAGHDINSMTENDLDLNEEFDPVGTSANVQRVVFIFDGKEEAESYLKSLGVDFIKRNIAWQVNLSTQSI